MSRCNQALLAVGIPADVQIVSASEHDGPYGFGEPCTGSGRVDFVLGGVRYGLAFEEWVETVVLHLFWPGGSWHSHTYNENNLPVSTFERFPL